jgi:hypothetical protein
VAKATFLTSIMDEIPLTPKTEPHPPLGPLSADRRKVFGSPEFAFPVVKPPTAPPPEIATNAGGLASPGSPVSAT